MSASTWHNTQELYTGLGCAGEYALRQYTENRTRNHIAARVVPGGVRLYVIFPEHMWLRATTLRFPFSAAQFDAALLVLDSDAEAARYQLEAEADEVCT